jgi:hypothetical protein
MPKYCFRKMYFICENKRVISPDVQRTNAFQHKEIADAILSQKDTSVKMWDVNKPPKVFTVEGFYLVHESLFDEILKEYSK